MSDSISQQLVAYLNSRMPRPDQVRQGMRAPMQAAGDAGQAFRGAGHDALLGALQFLAGYRPPPPRVGIPGVNGAPVESTGAGIVPPHYIGVRG